MSTESTKTTQTMKAGEDLRTHQFKALKISTAAADTVLLATALTGLNVAILGNKPNTGEAAEVIFEGFTKGMAGAAIATAGLELAADATGRLVAAASTNFVVAFSRMAAGAAGDIVEIYKIPGYFKP